MAQRPKADKFQLEVPLDASKIEGFEPDQTVKVVAQARDGSSTSATVELNKSGKATAVIRFAKQPGSLRLAIGPANATNEELLGMQTIGLDVSVRQWAEKRQLTLHPIVIAPFYWFWWLRWCRDFTIRGRVLCSDGSPVPGAEVCAFDVDYWWWWGSKQQVGCDTTDATGAFEITFRWCCGWWPWWWWRHRTWLLEPVLADRIIPVLQDELKILNPSVPSAKPNLGVFEEIIAGDGILTRQPLETVDPAALDGLRDRLLPRLPAVPAIERLHVWPWWPWHPWWDCNPDIIFQVTQDCAGQETVIVDESFFDTRWNIPTLLDDVELAASEEACCIRDEVHPEGDCIVITQACGDPVFTIGGNPGAAPAPAGYRNPGVVAVYGDRPYAGVVLIQGVFGDLAHEDYYEFEWSDDGGVIWNPMPAAAAGSFSRYYWGPQLGGGPVGFHPVPFAFTDKELLAFPGIWRRVIETRWHFEVNNDPASWGITRFWAVNTNLLMRWLTENNFADGTYHLRVRSWQHEHVGDKLTDPRVLPLCNTEQDNGLVLTIDNRIEGPASGHPTTPDHPCGDGTVHTCTTEPDTDFIAVSIVHADMSSDPIGACGNESITAGDTLRVDFMAHDPDGHLAYYTLAATYGENLNNPLLGLPGAVLSPLAAGPVPAAAQVGPNYGAARSPAQGAIAPTWHGGALRLEVPANLAFPVTCCYQLELRAYKRTIANCGDNYPHRNHSEFSFTIVV